MDAIERRTSAKVDAVAAGSSRLIGWPGLPGYSPQPGYGGFWLRLLAYLIDEVIIAIPIVVINIPISLINRAITGLPTLDNPAPTLPPPRSWSISWWV